VEFSLCQALQPGWNNADISRAGKMPASLLACDAMNFLGQTWIGEWLTGLGRIAVLTRDAVASCLTFKFSRREKTC